MGQVIFDHNNSNVSQRDCFTTTNQVERDKQKEISFRMLHIIEHI